MLKAKEIVLRIADLPVPATMPSPLGSSRIALPVWLFTR